MSHVSRQHNPTAPRPAASIAQPPIPTADDFVPLPREFYEPSAQQVAAALLGHWLVRRTVQGISAGWIVETEAYLADDPASHGYQRQTPRTRPMYGPPGYAYVYFIYGNHWCFNAVCGPAGVAEAVLVRAIEARVGLDWMAGRRPVADPRQLTNGPAKLCAALAIDRKLDAADLCTRSAGIWIARNPEQPALLHSLGPLTITTRVGITQAAARPLRFYLDGSVFVSRRQAPLAPRRRRAETTI